MCAGRRCTPKVLLLCVFSDGAEHCQGCHSFITDDELEPVVMLLSHILVRLKCNLSSPFSIKTRKCRHVNVWLIDKNVVTKHIGAQTKDFFPY